jgi:EspA/EspE family
MGVFGEFHGLGKAFWDRGVGGLNGVGEFVRSNGDLAGLDTITNVGERLATLGSKLPDNKLLRRVGGSEILDAGQLVIEGMRLTTGFGEPENGDRFGQGWSRFNGVGETLTSAYPDNSWSGAGANAYVDQNRSQAGRTSTVALLDRSVQTVIAREAYQVKYHRDKLDDQSNYLADLSYMTMALGLVPGVGKAMKTTVEVAAVNAALSICSLELYELSREAGQNAAELEQAAGRYAGVAETAKVTGTTSPSTPPPPPPPGVAVPPKDPQREGPPGVSETPGGVATGAGVAPPAPAPVSGSPAVAAPQDEHAAAQGAEGGLGQLGALLAPLGSLLAGAAQPAAPPPLAPPPAAPAAAPAAVPATASKDTAITKKDDTHEDQDDKEDKDTARGEGDTEHAPVHVEVDVDADRLDAPVTVTFDPDRPPTPPAATTPQE